MTTSTRDLTSASRNYRRKRLADSWTRAFESFLEDLDNERDRSYLRALCVEAAAQTTAEHAADLVVMYDNSKERGDVTAYSVASLAPILWRPIVGNYWKEAK